MASVKVKVALRVRPFNRREIEMDSSSVISMLDNQTFLQTVSDDKSEPSKKGKKVFTFDLCFDSLNPSSPSFASQETVFSAIGCDILDNVFKGYNACIFAYGQTGSGKSYTMMGSRDNPGIIPRLCNNLFDGISSRTCEDLDFHVQVSYMEIYNEKVHDLLDPCGGRSSLKVREHSLLGPYVDGLSVLAVSSFDDIEHVISEGNKSRTVAATNMNSESSRSHAVFTVLVTQTLTDRQSGVTGEKVSRVSLVDLAGSERANKTGAVGDRLKEGSNINRSLTTLGLVISKLAEASANSAPGGGKMARGRDNFIPYRDSVLTWLLKDNLGGNSKTIMVATVSPAADNYAETLSTLRYADRAKRIVNHAVINEDPNAKIIRELRKEVEELRQQLLQLKASGDDADLRQKLDENEKIMEQMSEPWEAKLQKTERLQHERQQALEKMGISVQAEGIGVQKNNFYLVNLNADPAMNELLVYYLKERTVVGLPESGGSVNDIQLCGLGIRPVHCVLTIEAGSLLMEPAAGARCCLNGAPVLSRVQLQHGDRVVWGNNHFFRVNCPRDTVSTPTTANSARNIDYAFAQQELISNEVYDSPLHSAIERLEQRRAPTASALTRDARRMRASFSAFSLQASASNLDLTRPPSSAGDHWSDEKEDSFRRSLSHLKQEIVRANALVREASSMAEELREDVSFSVTLQIPPYNLSPNCQRATFACEPAVLVKRGLSGGCTDSNTSRDSVWSMAVMEQRLADMREAYSEWKAGVPRTSITLQPFKPEHNDCHQLLGVANVFLEVLLHDVKLSYDVPVISQQAEVIGRLQVDLERVAGSFCVQPLALSDSVSSHSAESDGEEAIADTVTCRVTVRQVSGLCVTGTGLGRFIFCQYNFWGCSDTQVCAPVVTPSTTNSDAQTVSFHHCRDFVIPVCEEFVEHCAEGALSIEVWGHQGSRDPAVPLISPAPTTRQICASQQAQARSLADRWAELSRQLQLSVQLMELDDQGEYRPVQVLCQRCESPSLNHSASGGTVSSGVGAAVGGSSSVVSSSDDMIADGVYQLRQGQQRRVSIHVHPVSASGTLPLLCDTVTSVSIGSVVRSNTPLDSYQEHDLGQLRSLWTAALDRRKQYLDNHLQSVINKSQRSAGDIARERSLLEQWVQLSEERNAVLVPAAGSGIPGAPLPVEVRRPPGVERHVPVLFLDLNADDLTAGGLEDDEWNPSGRDDEVVAGHASLLSHERGDLMVPLSLVRVVDEPELVAVAQWDSSVHDSVHLNKISASGERIYLILRVCIRLSQPYPMDITLRKRLCVSIYKPTFANKLMKTITTRRCEVAYSTAVVYQVVSNVPRASEQLEERQSLAQMAAADDGSEEHGGAYIEKYLHGVSAVESLLRMDRLRQSVLVKELLQSSSRSFGRDCPGAMRKTASVPNISLFGRGDSPGSPGDSGFRADPEYSSFSPLARGLSDGWTRHSGRMSTVHEDEDAESSDCSGYLPQQQQQQRQQQMMSSSSSSSSSSRTATGRLANRHAAAQRIRFSRTFDSLVEIPGQLRGLASTASSGYGSQTVSSSSLLAPEASVDGDDDEDTVVADSDSQQHQLMLSESDAELSTSNRLASGEEDRSLGLDFSAAMNGSILSLDANTDSTMACSDYNPLTNVPDDALASEMSTPLLDCPGAATATDTDTSITSTSACSLPVWVSVGEPVLVRPHSHSGIIRYVGPVRFANGVWVGVELHHPQGRNDGSVHDVNYFMCKPRHGVFVRVDKLIWDHRKSHHSPSALTSYRTSSSQRQEHAVVTSVRRR